MHCQHEPGKKCCGRALEAARIANIACIAPQKRSDRQNSQRESQDNGFAACASNRFGVGARRDPEGAGSNNRITRWC
jgi:hypothetical protein